MKKIWKSLPVRSGLLILAGSILFTAIGSYYVYHRTYAEEIEVLKHRVEQLVNTVNTSASLSAYLDNETLGGNIINGLLRNDIVRGVHLTSVSGMDLVAGDMADPKPVNLRTFPLYAPVSGGEQCGTMVVRLNQAIVENQARQAAFVQVRLMVVFTLFLVGLVGFMVYWLLTLPLKALAQSLNDIEPGGERRLLAPRRHKYDEIGQLVRDINVLLGSTQNTLQDERERRNLAQTEAELDPLTHLYNRRAGLRQIERALQQSRHSHQTFSLLLVDLDRFKFINDTYGHGAGDKVLVTLAKRLKKSLRKSDVLIRWGGDEFLVMVQEEHDESEIESVAEKLVELVNRDIHLGDGLVDHVGASIGIALFPEHGSDPQKLIESADSAMYKVKQSGRNGFRIFGVEENSAA